MSEKLFFFTWIITDGLGEKTRGKDYFYSEKEIDKDDLDELLSGVVSGDGYGYELNEYGIRIKEPFNFEKIAPVADCGCDWKIGTIQRVSKKEARIEKK